jgi:hypothetical protein
LVPDPEFIENPANFVTLVAQWQIQSFPVMVIPCRPIKAVSSSWTVRKNWGRNGWQDVYIVDENEGIVYKRLNKTENALCSIR